MRTLGIVAALLLTACIDSTPKAVPTTPTPSPSESVSPSSTPTESIDPNADPHLGTKLFGVSLPAGWKEYRNGAVSDEQHLVGYSDGKGRYLKVLIWKAGGGCCRYDSDATWVLGINATGDGFVYKSKEPDCPARVKNRACSNGDGQFEVFAAVKDEPTAVHGYEFQFEFGFTHAERGVDTAVFKGIIESFRAR